MYILNTKLFHILSFIDKLLRKDRYFFSDELKNQHFLLEHTYLLYNNVCSVYTYTIFRITIVIKKLFVNVLYMRKEHTDREIEVNFFEF